MQLGCGTDPGGHRVGNPALCHSFFSLYRSMISAFSIAVSPPAQGIEATG